MITALTSSLCSGCASSAVVIASHNRVSRSWGWPSLRGTLVGSSVLLFSGGDALVELADDVRQPRRDLDRALGDLDLAAIAASVERAAPVAHRFGDRVKALWSSPGFPDT
jgi:hypothetical protein